MTNRQKAELAMMLLGKAGEIAEYWDQQKEEGYTEDFMESVSREEAAAQLSNMPIGLATPLGQNG